MDAARSPTEERTSPVAPPGGAERALRKAPTGIPGLDEITDGGLPAGRPSLICGGPGSGKTLLALSFLVNGATQFNEPGVFMSFEERAVDLAANCAALGYDLDGLIAARTLKIDHVRIERSAIEETGEYDLEGLFVRLGYAVDSIGAKRVALDTIEALFAGFADPGLLRNELRRLFGWLKDRGLSAIVTGERGEGQLTRNGLEEYVSDFVMLLDNRVHDQIATRRLRLVKYRGSSHGTNEYPFLIDAAGISVLPLTSPGLSRPVSAEVISSGVAGLDAMLRNRGLFRGSSVLLSGAPGTGKTSISSHFVDAACRRGERSMFFLFEESEQEVCRNMRSLGIDLQRWVEAGLLRFDGARPSLYGLEMHLARMHRDINKFRPAVVAIDPISAFRGPVADVRSALLRIIDLLKSGGITALFTSLRSDRPALDGTDEGLPSLMDTWIKLMDVESDGERNKVLYIIKSRGSSHSNQVREFRMTDSGVELVEAYVGPEGVLTGTARIILEARERAAAERRGQVMSRRRQDLVRRRGAIERQIAALRAALEAEEEEAQGLLEEDEESETTLARDRSVVAVRRGVAE